jgi:hypothetical protein
MSVRSGRYTAGFTSLTANQASTTHLRWGSARCELWCVYNERIYSMRRYPAGQLPSGLGCFHFGLRLRNHAIRSEPGRRRQTTRSR